MSATAVWSDEWLEYLTPAELEEETARRCSLLVATTRCAECYRPMLLDLVNNPHSLCADHREES